MHSIHNQSCEKETACMVTTTIKESINQPHISRVVQVVKSLQDPLKVGKNLMGSYVIATVTSGSLFDIIHNTINLTIRRLLVMTSCS